MKKTLLLLYFCTLVLPLSAWGAITFDTATTATCGPCASVNVPVHTIGGSCTNSLLVVGAAWEDAGQTISVSVATSGTGGGTLTSRRANEVDGDAAHSLNFSSLAGASGAQSVTATFSGGTPNEAGITVTSYCGVDQTTPHAASVGASGNDTPITADLAASAGEWVIDVAFSHSSLTVGALQNQRANVVSGAGYTHASSDEPGPGTLTMSWTQSAGHYWATVGLVVKAAAATPTRKRLVMVE